MPSKLFIVDQGNDKLYEALRRTLAGEPDVAIIYDRRTPARPTRWDGPERRTNDVRERIRTDGFAVVRPAPPVQRPGNIRWTA